MYIEERLPTRWPSIWSCSQQRQRVNGHIGKGAKNWKTMNHSLFYATSSLPILCHRGQSLPPTTACMAGMEPVHGKEVEQPHILNFLTYGGAIRREGPKPAVVHDRLERIAITLPATWPAAGPRAETAYTARPFSDLRNGGRPRSFMRGRQKRTQTASRNLDKENGV